MTEGSLMRPLSVSEHDAWDGFVAASATGTVFHTAWWHRAWGADVTVLARKDGDGNIEAGLPMHIGKFPSFMGALGVRGIRRPPLTQLNGPVFNGCAKTNRSSAYSHTKRELLRAITSLPQMGFYDFALGRSTEDIMPFLWNGFDAIVHYTYIIRATDAEGWRRNMSEHARRALKGAHKEGRELGCAVEADPPFEDIKPLLVETSRAKRFSYDRYMDRLPTWWAEVKRRDAGRSYVLRGGDGSPLCASCMVWDGRSAYCLLTGMRREVRRDSHLTRLLFERMITDSLAEGRDFDFEGSSLIGVEHFFRGWGGELRPYYRVTKMPSAFAYLGWTGYIYLKKHRRRGWVAPD